MQGPISIISSPLNVRLLLTLSSWVPKVTDFPERRLNVTFEIFLTVTTEWSEVQCCCNPAIGCCHLMSLVRKQRTVLLLHSHISKCVHIKPHDLLLKPLNSNDKTYDTISIWQKRCGWCDLLFWVHTVISALCNAKMITAKTTQKNRQYTWDNFFFPMHASSFRCPP